MRALIYARGVNATIIMQMEESKEYCREHNIEVGGYYSDEEPTPSRSKNMFKGLQKLIEDLRQGDCIICENDKILPHFFKKTDFSSIKIIYSGKDHFDAERMKEVTINIKEKDDFLVKKNKAMARLITDACVRSTCIEDFHAGSSPYSLTGDYSDVKVVFPGGEIPWLEVSMISDEEMRELMLEVEKNIVAILHLFLIGYSVEKLNELSSSFFNATSYCYDKNHDNAFTTDQNHEFSEAPLQNHLPGNYDHILNDRVELEKLLKYLFHTSGVSWDNPALEKK